MAKNKTAETTVSVTEFLQAIPQEQRRKDCFEILAIMEKASGYAPRMWGPSIIGFGSYHYVYESGHEGDAPMAGFASRSNGIVLYLDGSPGEREHNLEKLGSHKLSKGCIYIKKLADVKVPVLSAMVRDSIVAVTKRYPPKS